MSESNSLHEGGCMCGAVRYRLSGPFTFSAHCHCRSCQRAVGAGFVTDTAVAPDDFEVIKGKMMIYHSSPGVCRGFCSQCGTSLSYSGDDWTDYAIMTATLDDPAVASPTANAYTKDKQPWIALDETLKNYHEFS